MTDTLTSNRQLLQGLQADETFDYGSELHAPDKSLMEWVSDLISDFIDSILGDTLGNDNLRPLFAIIAVVLILVVIYLVYRYKPELFGREGKTTISYTVTEDTIYGIDFDEEIACAIASANYNEAVRLLYLQTLRWLSDNKKIDWQIYKTPTQYIREFTSPQFRSLSNVFIRVRYGNYTATEDNISTMRNLQEEIKKGGEE